MTFLTLWSQTLNFKQWVKSHNDTKLLAALSPQYPSEETVDVMIYYETGDFYKGGLRRGQRNGTGFYSEKQARMTYTG